MRIYVVHPGASFSTHDVYTGIVSGLCANNHDVFEGRLDTIMGWYETAFQSGIKDGSFHLEAAQQLNTQRLASAHITQHILDVWPELVIVVSGHNYHTQDVEALRRIGFRTAVVLTESPYFLDAELLIARHYDVATTNERLSANLLNQVTPTSYLPHAYQAQIHNPFVPPDPMRVSDVVFIGSLFDERRALLDGVDWTGINLLTRGYHLDTGVIDVVPNLETVQYYRSSKIALNHHRTTTSHGSGQHIAPGAAESLGPRAYEIAACGAFQLMDDTRSERFDVFGDTAPTYRAANSSDVEQLIRYYLSKPDERERIAQAMSEAVAPHHWTNRANQLLEAVWH